MKLGTFFFKYVIKFLYITKFCCFAQSPQFVSQLILQHLYLKFNNVSECILL